MLPTYFNCIFEHLRQKARLRPESSRKLLSTLGTLGTLRPNPTRKVRTDLQLRVTPSEDCAPKERNRPHGRSQGGAPSPIEMSSTIKCDKNAYCFFSFF